MNRRPLALASIALAATALLGQAAPQKPVKLTDLTVGKPLHTKLVKEDPVEEGRGRIKAFRFTATDEGDYTASAESFAFDVTMIVQDGEGTELVGLPPWNEDRGRGDGERLTIHATKGDSYRIVVASASKEVGEFDVSVETGEPEWPTFAQKWKTDFDFFQAVLKQSNDRRAWPRAVVAGWESAEAAIHLGHASDAESMVKGARAALEKATTLPPEELDLTRARLDVLDGQVALLRSSWKDGLALFTGAEQRCDGILSPLDSQRPPAEPPWKRDFQTARRAAIAGKFGIEYGRGDRVAARELLRTLFALEKCEQVSGPNGLPTPTPFLLLELLDRPEDAAEAAQFASACAACVETNPDLPHELMIPYCRYLLGRGQYVEAIDRMRKLLDRVESQEIPLAIRDVASFLSATCLELGNYADAQEMADRAIEASLAAGDDPTRAAALIDRAEAKRSRMLFESARKDDEEALVLLDKSKAMPRKAEALISLMMIDIGEGKHDDAVKRMDPILQCSAANGRPDAITVFARIELGEALLSKAVAAGAKSFDAANAEFERAFHEADDLHDRHGAALANLYLADIACRTGDHKRGCDLASSAAEELRALGRFEELHYPLQTIASSALSENDPARARKVLMDAEASLDFPTAAGILGRSAGDLRAHLWLWGSIEQELVAVAVKSRTLDPAAKPDDRLPQDGLLAAWRWKSRALLSGIAEHARPRDKAARRTWSDLHESAAQQERDSKALDAAYLKTAASPEIDALRKRMADSETRMHRLENELRGKSPTGTDGRIPTLAELQKEVLGDDTLLIEFVNGLEDLYAYAVDANAVRRVDLGKRADLEKMADAYCALISRQTPLATPNEIATQGQKLYAQLLEPALQGASPRMKRLLIAPTTRLGALPFEALVTKTDVPSDKPDRKVEKFRQIKYVLDQWVAALVPSGAVAVELARRSPRGTAGDWLLLGSPGVAPKVPTAGAAAPVIPDKRSTVAAERSVRAPTPGMSAELLFVADLLAKGTDLSARLEKLRQMPSGSLPSDRFDLHLGTAATQEVLESDLNRFAVLHFACHGEFDRSDPRDAALLLAPNGAHSGRLGILEVLELELDANLTILSACSSARGRGFEGDGEQSLARAFLYAGSRSVVATLWTAFDQPTNLIMDEFDKTVFTEAAAAATHADFAVKLHDAKLKLRRGQIPRKEGSWGPDEVPPVYWAGVVYYGIGPKK